MLLPFTLLENIRSNFKTASNLLMIVIFCITPESSVIFNNIIFSEKWENQYRESKPQYLISQGLYLWIPPNDLSSSKQEKRRQRKDILSLPISLSNSSTRELPQNGNGPRPSTPALHSEINIQCVLSLESTQRKQRSRLFYRAHQSWVPARIFLFQGTDQLLWLKTKLLYNETKRKRKKKKKNLVFCKVEWKLNVSEYLNIITSGLCLRFFDWNAKPFFQ